MHLEIKKYWQLSITNVIKIKRRMYYYYYYCIITEETTKTIQKKIVF